MPNEMPKYRLTDNAREKIERALEFQAAGDSRMANLSMGIALETFAAEFQEHLAKALSHRFVFKEAPPSAVRVFVAAPPAAPTSAEQFIGNEARWAEQGRARAAAPAAERVFDPNGDAASDRAWKGNG